MAVISKLHQAAKAQIKAQNIPVTNVRLA